MTAKRKGDLPREGSGNFRLYITVRHQRRDYDLSEGPYRFRTARDALTWLKWQADLGVYISEASLWHHEELIAKADLSGPQDVGRSPHTTAVDMEASRCST